MHTQAIAVSEKKLFVRPSSKMLAMLSSLHFIPAAHHVELVLSLFVIFLLSPCFTSKTSEMVYTEAHSSARRFRGEVVCLLKQQNARALLSSHFIPAAHHVSLFSAYSLTFAVLTSKMSEMVTRKRTRARAVSEEKRFVRPSKSQKSKQHYARVAVVIALYPGCASRELVLA